MWARCILYTVCGEPRPGFVARGGARGHGPGRANGLYVVVVGDVGCRPVLQGARKAAIGSLESRLPPGDGLGAGTPRALLTRRDLSRSPPCTYVRFSISRSAPVCWLVGCVRPWFIIDHNSQMTVGGQRLALRGCLVGCCESVDMY